MDERTDSSKTSLTDSGMTGSSSAGKLKRGACRELQATISMSPIASMRIDRADTTRIDMAATVPDTPIGCNEDDAPDLLYCSRSFWVSLLNSATRQSYRKSGLFKSSQFYR